MATIGVVLLLLLLAPTPYLAAAAFCHSVKAAGAAFSRNASSSPVQFATTTIDQAPDVVYALALCLGDVLDSSACGACITDWFTTVNQTQCDTAGSSYRDCIIVYGAAPTSWRRPRTPREDRATTCRPSRIGTSGTSPPPTPPASSTSPSSCWRRPRRWRPPRHPSCTPPVSWKVFTARFGKYSPHKFWYCRGICDGDTRNACRRKPEIITVDTTSVSSSTTRRPRIGGATLKDNMKCINKNSHKLFYYHHFCSVSFIYMY
ncbi:hypothetical protein VPH35_049162 [Triticum aestivum]